GVGLDGGVVRVRPLRVGRAVALGGVAGLRGRHLERPVVPRGVRRHATLGSVHAETRRLLAMLILGLLVSATGSLFLVRSVQPARAAGRDNPVGSLEVGQQSTTTSTAAPARQPVAQSGGPVDVPVDSYASEPVIQIGTIEIPKIGLVSPIFHGITLRNIDHGPSHWPGTAFPGETGNAVFAGHRVTHTHPFLHIDRLEAGDQVTFTVQGIRTVYVVTGH